MGKQDRTEMIRTTFDTVAEGYDSRPLRFFSESAKHMPKCLDLMGHEHILDVATGTGAVAMQLARNLPHGLVTGIDFSGGMLAKAKTKAKAQELHNITFLEMDMQSIGFPDSLFDAAVCSFGLFFVEDMDAQLKHIVEKIKTGGQVVISSFYEDSFSPLADMFLTRAEKSGVATSALAWKKIATEAKCVSLYQGAGLVDVRVIRRDLGYYLKNDQEWWDLVWWGGFRRFVSGLSPSALEAFRTEHLREVESLRTTHGTWLNLKVLYTVGTKPS
jgi:ubiquinone/menaquinone biosynthesis C-methylase UbiE